MRPGLSEQTSPLPAGIATPNGSGPLPQTVAVDVLLLYTRGHKLLVGLRHGGYAAGQSDTPSGKLDLGETLEQGMACEAREEAGLTLEPDQLRMGAMTHWHPPDGPPRLSMFFHLEADTRVYGEPRVAEPHKCAELWWAPRHALRAPLMRYAQVGVELITTGRLYAAMDRPLRGPT